LVITILDLTKYGSEVHVLVRRDELRASKIMQKRLFNNPKIVSLRHLSFSSSPVYTSFQKIHWNTVALEAKGDGDLLKGLRIKNIQTGEESDLAVNGLFYAVGHEPATALVRDQIDTDEDGYILTVPGTTKTSVKVCALESSRQAGC
jgi:thioredoxin reductase (NADPH)